METVNPNPGVVSAPMATAGQVVNPNTEAFLSQMVPEFAETITTGNVVKAIQRSRVVVEMLKRGDFQKTGTITAVLRQRLMIVSTYPSISIDNDKQQNPFALNEFQGAGAGTTYPSRENRVAFIDVPENSTLDQVQAKIDANAHLYRIMSSDVILTNNHINAIQRGLTTKDLLAQSQVARYPQGDAKAGQIVPDTVNNKPLMYRKTFFWNGVKADEDLRGGDAFISDALRAELPTVNTPVAPVQAGHPGVTVQPVAGFTPETPVTTGQLV